MAYVLWTGYLQAQPRRPALARPRPLRPLRRARLDAALQPAPPDRLRPAARRAEALPPVGQHDAGPPRARPHPRRRGDDRPARPGLRQRRRHGDRRGAAWRRTSTGRATRSSTTTPTRIVCDGDLMEGVAYEAASLAGHLRLGKLIYLYDQNHITLDGGADLDASPRTSAARFAAFGWHVHHGRRRQRHRRGRAALDEARADHATGPRSSLVRTHIGFGSPHKQDTLRRHGNPLGADEVAATKEALGWPTNRRLLSARGGARATSARRSTAAARRRSGMADALRRLRARRTPTLAAEFVQRAQAGELPDGWDAGLPRPGSRATSRSRRAWRREATHCQALAAKIPTSSAARPTSTPRPTRRSRARATSRTRTSARRQRRRARSAARSSYAGRNIHFGIREHAMGALRQRHGRPRRRDPLRRDLPRLLRLHAARRSGSRRSRTCTRSTSSRTTASAVGEDGPTHEPIEHLPSLRAIPNLTVIRPGDANETVEAWVAALRRTDGPTAFVLTRQNLPILDRSAARKAARRKGPTSWPMPRAATRRSS